MNFDKFKGMQEEREVAVREKGSLEIMLDFCDDLIKKYKCELKYAQVNNFSSFEEKAKIYSKIYGQIKEKLVFDEQDLLSFIFMKANTECDELASVVLGLCTGVLLHSLTERNKTNGKRTRFCINGQGNKFDYLFYLAKEIDELIVDSFVGDELCAYAGNTRGADTIIIKNCKGDAVAGWAGCLGGKVRALILANNQGNYVACYAARYAGGNEGNIETLMIANHRGDYAANGAGSYDKKMINELVLYNITGNDIAHYADAKQIITGEEAKKEYERICKENDLEMLT